MFKLMMLAGLLGGTAEAAPFDVEGPSQSSSRKGPFSGTPIEDVGDKMEEKKTKEQLETAERIRKLAEARSKQNARVVVLQERITDVGYKNDVLRRNVIARISRTDAKFYPDVDLYQAGRKEPDPTLRPLDQRGTVPDEAIAQLNEAWTAVSAIPWNALDETEWGERAATLKSLADSVWFVDRPELRAPMFNLYAQIGRAAENSNNPIPPYFEQVARVDVNYYFYLAASMAHRDASLMSDLTDPELYQNVDYIRQRLDAGEFAPMTLNFELGGDWDVEAFTSEYKVFFNGLDDQITNDRALYDVPPGRMDVFLERPGDGYGMSVRVDAVKVDSQDIESVRDQARKRMGIDFIEQLMKNPEQCIPDVEGDILNYLAIYQKLHPGQEIYIAVPEGGSAQRIYLWLWVPDQGTLIRINDNTGGFPVRFVGLFGTGLSFNGASLKPIDQIEYFNTPQDPNNFDPGSLADAAEFKASSAPIAYELRGHYNRLMVGLGMEYHVSLSGSDNKFREIPRTKTADHVVAADGAVAFGRDRILLDQSEDDGPIVPYTNELPFSRGVFLSVAGVLGKDAAFGFGPRIGMRTGWYNAPHAVDLTAHGGYSLLLTRDKKKEKPDSRVHAIADTDVFAGAMVPFADSLLLLAPVSIPNVGADPENVGWSRQARGSGEACIGQNCTMRKMGAPILNFGFTIKAGLTF